MLLIGFFCWQLCWGNTGSRLNKMLISQGNTMSTWSFNRGTDNRTYVVSVLTSQHRSIRLSSKWRQLEQVAQGMFCLVFKISKMEPPASLGKSVLMLDLCYEFKTNKKNCLHGVVLSSILCLLSLSLVLLMRCSLSPSSFLSPSGVVHVDLV